jgi:inner membrane transporter RhtA
VRRPSGSYAASALAILTGLASLNIGAALGKSLFPAVGADGVAALRTSISALILVAVWRPCRTRLDGRQAGNLIVYGMMMGLMSLLIYRAFQTIPIGIAVGIEIMGPLCVVLFSSRRPADFLWLACGATGLLLLLPIASGVARLDPVGVVYAIGAAACWALYIIFGKRSATIEGDQAVALGMVVAALVTLPLGLAHAGSALLAPATLALGLVVALLSSAIPFSLEMIALKRLSNRSFGVLVGTAPAVGALAGYAILGETLTGLQWGAISLIILAAAGSAGSASAP